MERLLCFFAVAVVIAFGTQEAANAQEFSRNTVYTEVSASGNMYGISYERRLTPFTSARTGVLVFRRRFAQLGGDRIDVSAIPIMFNFLDGFHRLGKHRLELGTGPLVGAVHGVREDRTVSRAVRGGAIVAAGYRYQPLGEGLLVRIGGTGLLYVEGRREHDVRASFNLSLGYTF